MAGWKWIDKSSLLILHDESLTLHGGTAGIRDEGLLDSALNRAPNLALYGEPDCASLAAAYGFGIAKNHPFVDGNKRTAFLSVGMFLAMNGMRLKATQVDATLTMLAVAAGEMDEAAFAVWLRHNSEKRV